MINLYKLILYFVKLCISKIVFYFKIIFLYLFDSSRSPCGERLGLLRRFWGEVYSCLTWLKWFRHNFRLIAYNRTPLGIWETILKSCLSSRTQLTVIFPSASVTISVAKRTYILQLHPTIRTLYHKEPLMLLVVLLTGLTKALVWLPILMLEPPVRGSSSTFITWRFCGKVYLFFNMRLKTG